MLVNMYGYIGIVTKIQNKQAYIRPLYKLQSGKTIQAFKPGELSKVFFNGLVVWDRVPAYVYQDSLWLFDVNDVNQQKAVIRIEPLVEALHVGKLVEGKKTSSFFRDEPAFLLSYTPSERAYLLLGNAVWAGPIPLLPQNIVIKSNIWYGDLTSFGGYMPLFNLAAEHFISLKGIPSRKFISPWYTPEKPIKYMKISKRTIYSSERVTITQSLTEAEKKNQISPFKNINSDKRVQSQSQISAQIEQSIQSTKVNKQELTAQQRVAIEKEIAKKEQLLQQELDILEQRFKQKKEDISKELADLDRLLAMQKTENRYQINKMKQSFENEKKTYQQTLQQLQEKGIHQITVSQNMAAIRNPSQKQSSWSWTHAAKGKISLLSESSTVKKRLQEANKQYEKPSSVFLSVHSTLLAGGVPVLVGESALDILETYAACVTGGRVLWLPIAPSLLESADLIGKPDAATRNFVPHAAGLADLLLEAKRRPDNLYLVVLDGINRAAIEHYLQPMLNLYHELWHTSRTHSFPFFHSHAVLENDPYAELAQMHLTQNILITATLSDGMAVIPPPASFWSKAAFIDADIARFELGERDTMASALNEFSAIPASNWLIMHSHLKKRATTISLEDINVSVLVGNNEGSLFRKILYHALSEYLADKKIAADMVAMQAMMPRALTTGREGELLSVLKNRSQAQQQMIKKIKSYVR